jgi:hypothetical protein
VVRVVYCSMNLFFERGVGNPSGADGPQNADEVSSDNELPAQQNQADPGPGRRMCRRILMLATMTLWSRSLVIGMPVVEHVIRPIDLVYRSERAALPG